MPLRIQKSSKSDLDLVTKDKESYVGTFQALMKKLSIQTHLPPKLKILNDIEQILYMGSSSIDVFVLNYPYYLDEFTALIKPELHPDLRIRALRVISTICTVSNQLRELFKKRMLFDVLCSNVLTDMQTSAQVKRWAIHTLIFLCVKDNGIPTLVRSDVKIILERMADKEWFAWGNNDARDLLEIVEFQ